MEVKGTPSIKAPVTIDLPAKMALPVHTDGDGFIVPATGFVWQKYLNYDTLEALGVSIEWRHPSGALMGREEAVALIGQAMAREAAPQVPASPKAANDA
jgi:hypothetical protein